MKTRGLTTAAAIGVALIAVVVAIALGACGGPDEMAATGAAAIAGSPAPAAGATVTAAPAGPGTIAFTRNDRDGSHGICTVRSDGTGFTSLAATINEEEGAAWSPDGDQIAYARLSGVWVMGADGSDQHLVVHHGVWLRGLAWSPDGTRIVATACDVRPPWPWVREGDANLIVVNADGTGLADVTAPAFRRSDSCPAWAPDGRILFTRETRGVGAICSIGPDGGGLEVVTAVPVPSSFALSPDGKWLAIWDRDSDAIVRLSADGLGMPVVLVPAVSAYVEGRVALSWSPDASAVAFAAHAGAGPWIKPSTLYVTKWRAEKGDQVEGDVQLSARWSKPTAVPNAGKGFDPAWRPR